MTDADEASASVARMQCVIKKDSPGRVGPFEPNSASRNDETKIDRMMPAGLSDDRDSNFPFSDEDPAGRGESGYCSRGWFPE